MEGAELGTTRRARGRPLGSTRYKEVDSRIIARAGDAILADTTLTTRAAIVRAVKRETGKEDTNALRRVQTKMDRTAAVAAASERREEKRRQDEHTARVLLTMLDFATGGRTFRHFMAQPEMQDLTRSVMAFLVGAREVAEDIRKHILLPVAQATAPIVAELRRAQTQTVIDAPRLR